MIGFWIFLININFVFCQIFNRPQNVLTSLVTPIIAKSECYTTLDNRVGQCMTRATCLATGGLIAGNCGLLMACCIYQGSCRAVMNANETYFVSPNYPATQTDRLNPPMCIFTLQRNNLVQKFPICQIRLDFNEFVLAPPFNGTCGHRTDSFVISGVSNFNASGLPPKGLCGDLTGQHMYINVNSQDLSKPLLLIVNTANEQHFNRKWSILIQQIPCHSPFKAPSGCLQYFTRPEGIVESLNFRGKTRSRPPPSVSVSTLTEAPVSNPNYFNEMNYGICVAQAPEMCGIKWTADYFDFGGNLLGHSSVGIGTGSNMGCSILNKMGNDFGDFITISGGSEDGQSLLQDRFCGQRLAPESNLPENKPVISFTKPFIVNVKSDASSISQSGAKNERGFQLKYEQIECH